MAWSPKLAGFKNWGQITRRPLIRNQFRFSKNALMWTLMNKHAITSWDLNSVQCFTSILDTCPFLRLRNPTRNSRLIPNLNWLRSFRLHQTLETWLPRQDKDILWNQIWLDLSERGGTCFENPNETCTAAES